MTACSGAGALPTTTGSPAAGRARRLYGPSGWTDRMGVAGLLGIDGQSTASGGLIRFEGLTGDAAAGLLEGLPREQLLDRQNFAPELGRLLSAAVDHPGDVLLSGYWVQAPRSDERVSVDGALVRVQIPASLADGPVTAAWEAVGEVLGLGECGAPDEFTRWLFADDGTLGWWIWWD